MKEYTLIIKGEMDFIIIAPQVLSSLITQIHNSPERFSCFQTIHLADTFRGNVELDMECNDLFFWACKDTSAKFIYTFPDGRQETLMIEY